MCKYLADKQNTIVDLQQCCVNIWPVKTLVTSVRTQVRRSSYSELLARDATGNAWHRNKIPHRRHRFFALINNELCVLWVDIWSKWGKLANTKKERPFHRLVSTTDRKWLFSDHPCSWINHKYSWCPPFTLLLLCARSSGLHFSTR